MILSPVHLKVIKYESACFHALCVLWSSLRFYLLLYEAIHLDVF